MTNPTQDTPVTNTRKVRTMKPTAIVVTVTCTTASGYTQSFSHPAESGEWFLNSLLLAAIPATHRLGTIGDDPYQMRAMNDRLMQLWEDENIRASDADIARERAAELLARWESSRMTDEEVEQFRQALEGEQ